MGLEEEVAEDDIDGYHGPCRLHFLLFGILEKNKNIIVFAYEIN